MENQPVEDVFPIENGDFPLSCWFSIVDVTTSYRGEKEGNPPKLPLIQA